MILTTTRQAIIQALDDSYFGGANFNVSFAVENAIILTVTFIPNADFKFTLEALPHSGYAYTVSPGLNVLTAERYGCSSVADSVKLLADWAKRVQAEITLTNPLAREVANFREEIEARLSAMGEQLEQFFTREEADALIDKLNSTITRLDELQAKNSELTAASEKLTATVRQLQEATTEVNKGTWLRMASGKLTALAKSVLASKEAREFALEAAKKVLLEGPK